jgi:L-iditol 2-dehydrogenase/galactitol-1-phosphate 5-dehydrogenase
MKALVLEADGQLVFRDDYPVPAAPDARPAALIRVAACGVCGSDIPRAFSGKAYFYPLVMGHEFSGVVEEPVPGGKFSRGDRVAIFPLIPKNMETDPACQTGDYAQARDYDYYGSRRTGAFSEYLRVPEWNLVEVPEHVNLLHASMTEPAAVALHGVRRMRVQPGDDAAVFGAGPVGNMAAQWLRISGCSRVFMVDIEPRKLRIAEEMGFIPIDSRQGDPVKQILDATGGEGVQRSIEACGLPITFLQATQVAGRTGEVVFMGNIAGEFKIGEKDFSSILRRELTIYGTWNSKLAPAGTDDWRTVLKHLDRDLVVAPLISDKPPLSDGAEIFADLFKRTNYHNKVIFNISPADNA